MAIMILGVIFGVIYLIYKIGEDNTGGIVGFISGLFSLGYCAVIFAILAIICSEESREIFGIYQGNIAIGAVGYAVLLISSGIIYFCRSADESAIKDDELYKKDWQIRLKALCKMWFWCIICGIIFQTFSGNSKTAALFVSDNFGGTFLYWILWSLYLIAMLGSPFITFGIYYVLRLFKKCIMKLCGLEDNSRPLIEDAILGIEPTHKPGDGFPLKKDAKKKRRNK